VKYLDAEPRGEGYLAALRETEIPRPRADEVLVRVVASGVNRADLSQIAGRYPPPPGESEILGLEVSGTLLETGVPVCALLAGGGHAQFVSAPKGQIFSVPAGVDLLSAAGIPEAFLTAFLNLGDLKKGEHALIHAGASGVGLAAIQTAKFLGASVAGTTRSSSKLAAIKKAGADLAIDTSAGKFAEAIEGAWGRDSVDLILDPVGAATLADDLRVISLGGRIIFLATMSGAHTDFDIALLMKKRARVIGSTLRSRPRPEKADLVGRFQKEILPGFESGALSVHVDSVFAPARAAEAYERLKANKSTGKILFDWRGLG
jgi:putative PIG3 family NAD(P)H quinone oxidoreductase